MPTYACWAEAELLTADRKQRIATALTEIHHEVALAPRYFVQVVFAELSPGCVYVAGVPTDARHVWIRADIRAGRTAEQKAEMLDRITGEVAEIVGGTAADVWVYLSDIPGASVAEYGRSLPDPGQEDAWFAALPADLRDRLRPIA